MENDGFKACPFCKEKIRAEAIKCRFCGEWLEQVSAGSSALQSAAEGPCPPPLQKASEQHAAVGKKGPISNQSKITGGISAKTRYWIGGTILTGCVFVFGLFLFMFVQSPHWKQLSPGENSYYLTKVIFGLFMMLVGATASVGFTKDKSKKFLAYSVTLAVLAAIAAYYFVNARHKTQEKAQEADKQLVTDLNNAQEFVKHGAVGDIPQLKLTGAPENDAFSRVMNDFYQNYIPAYREACSAIQNLGVTDVFDSSLLTNKLNLESEIDKRSAAQKIIERLASYTTTLIDTAEKQNDSQNVSADSKQGVRKALRECRPGFDAMFTSWIRQRKAEQDFLQFLDDNFSDFEIQQGQILFRTQGNAQKYSDLAKGVQDAVAEIEDVQARANAKTDAAKAKLQEYK